MSEENAKFLVDNHSSVIKDLLNIACKKIVANDPINLELTEEKLSRLLQASCEGDLNLSDLKDMTLTIKANNKEVEILYGKDFSNMKYTVISGFNLEKVTKHFEVILADNPAKLIADQGKNINTYVSDKAVLMSAQDIQSEKYYDVILNAKIIITFGYDMQKFSDYWESNQPKSAAGKGKDKKDKKDDKKEEKKEEKKEGSIDLIPESKGEKKKKRAAVKYPNCLVNLSEKSFNEIIKELQEQKNQSL